MVKNAFYNLLTVVSGPLFNAISIPVVTKALGPDAFGAASVALSYISYFTIVSTLGVSIYGTREIGRARGNDVEVESVFNELFILTIISSILGALLFSAVILAQGEDIGLIVVVGATSIFMTFLNVEWLFHGFENYKITAVRTFLSKAIGLLLLLLLVNSEDDVLEYVSITVLSTAIPAIYTFFMHKIHVKLRIQGLDLSRHFKSIFSFLYIRGFSAFYTTLDIAIVGYIAGPLSAGIYALAIRVARIFSTLVCSLTAVSLPRASALLANNDLDGYRKLIVDIMLISISISMVVAGLTVMMSDWIVQVLGGGEYAESVPVLVVLSLMIPVVALSNYSGIQILYPHGKEKVVASSLMAGSLVCVVAMPIAIGLADEVGAGVAILLSESAVLSVQFFSARKILRLAFAAQTPRLLRYFAANLTWVLALLLFIGFVGDRGLIFMMISAAFMAAIYMAFLMVVGEPMAKKLAYGVFRR